MGAALWCPLDVIGLNWVMDVWGDYGCPLPEKEYKKVASNITLNIFRG